MGKCRLHYDVAHLDKLSQTRKPAGRIVRNLVLTETWPSKRQCITVGSYMIECEIVYPSFSFTVCVCACVCLGFMSSMSGHSSEVTCDHAGH